MNEDKTVPISYQGTDMMISTQMVFGTGRMDVDDPSGGGGGQQWGGYEDVNHYGHISKFPTEAISGIAKFSVQQTAQTIRMTSSELEVAKLIGNIGKVAKFTGIAGEAVVVGANIYNIATNPTAENYARAGISGLAIGVNALNFVVPGLGLGLSLGITAIDAAGGFNWFYDDFK